QRGVEAPSLNREKVWEFVPTVQVGAKVTGGDVLGTVQETEVVLHKIMVPPGIVGTVQSIAGGRYRVTDTVAVLQGANGEELPITLLQKWPVRRGRPYGKKLSPD